MKSLLGASAFVALFAGAALAADPVAPAAPASAALVICDFFQNQLISTFCAQSVDVAGTVSGSEDRRRTLTNFGGAFSYRQTFVSGGGSLSVTPLSWLRLSASSSYAQSDVTVRNDPFNNGGVTAKTRSSYVSWQDFAASVNLLDTGPGDTRYVVNVLGGAGFIPARTGLKADSRIIGQITGAARWRLGASDYSLNFRSTLQGERVTQFREGLVQTTARLLLAQDVWGVALGPSFSSSHLATVNGGLPRHSNAYFGGVTALWQPFRASATPVLRALTLQGTAAHSIGNAAFTNYDRSRAMTYSANAALHFQY